MCTKIDKQCSKLRGHHSDQMERLGAHQTHAQAWVITALYGLLLFCGGQQRAAGEALSFAKNAAYLVGDLESHNLVCETLSRLGLSERARRELKLSPVVRDEAGPASSTVAFISSFDNVNAVSSRYGVPPVLSLRAILHRAMLFADSIAAPQNVLLNESNLVNQLLFDTGEKLNDFYASFLRPVMFLHDTPADRKAILSNHRANMLKRPEYLAGVMAQSHIQELDRYFESVGVEDRYIFCSPKGVFVTFDKYIRKAVTERRELTKAYLIDRWRNIADQDGAYGTSTSACRDGG